MSHSLLARGFEIGAGLGFEGGVVGVALRDLEGRRGVAELLESDGGLREKDTVVVVVAAEEEGGWCLGEKMVVLEGTDKCEVENERGSIVIVFGVCRSSSSIRTSYSVHW